MKITHINATDRVGGHGRAAYRLSTGLRRLGHDSRLLVFQKDLHSPDVIRFQPPADVPTRLRRILLRHYLARRNAVAFSDVRGAHFMSDGRSEHRADLLRQALPCDILHLHWVAGLFDYRHFFQQLPRSQRLVWTLHDMSPFTGGCDHDAGCGRFRDHCGACPHLSSMRENDITVRTWEWKQRAYGALPREMVRLVAPSRWMAGEIQKSALFGRFPVSVIPHGLDTEQFQPRDRKFARELLGIPPASRVVLFLADGAGNKRKGLYLLLEALAGLEGVPDLFLLVVGQGACLDGLRIPGKATGFLADDLSLSLAYSASDLFALPSLVENLPCAGLESLACGTPMVAFRVGGVPDMVREGETGLLVPRGDSAALRKAILEILQDPERRAAMAANCRRVAMREYSLDLQATRYAALYEEMGREQANRPAA